MTHKATNVTMINENKKEILTIAELLEREKVSRSTIYRRLQESTVLFEGRYKGYKIGPTHWRFEVLETQDAVAA